ncbi:MAG: DUF1992 domain-containing protein [Deltaproteobacteria bacterium]|nr:MAG: DUF1992 domain-containing protein [Deltaproteobacteria bacterium]
MKAFQRLAEQRIREAIERGDLDDLPGRGRPLQLEDLSMVPEDLRMAFKVMKNAGVLPEEMQLEKKIARLRELIRLARTRPRRALLEKELRQLLIEREIRRERRALAALRRRGG